MPPVNSRITTRSTPSSNSSLSGEALVNSGNICTGLMLAKTCNAARSARIPCSGRIVALGSDHFGPPTAPSMTALLSLQLATESSGNGSPFASMAAPPGVGKAVSKNFANGGEHFGTSRRDFGANSITRQYSDQGVQDLFSSNC